MLWFLFAGLTAVFESLKDVTSKRGLQNLDEYVISWSMMFFTLPILWPLLAFIGVPEFGDDFGWALLVSGSTNVVAMFLYIRALKLTDLSIAVPLITFTPLFLLIVTPLLIGENPTATDAIGVILIVSGSYILNLKDRSLGYLAPFKSLLREPGARLMLAVAFIWSITSTVDKVGVQNSSATFWAIAVHSYVTVGLTPLMLFKSRDNIEQIPKNLKALLPIGIFLALAVLCQMQAISMTLVARVISIKRMSALLGVFFGHLIFQEKGLKERALGASVMITGVVCITLF